MCIECLLPEHLTGPSHPSLTLLHPTHCPGRLTYRHHTTAHWLSYGQRLEGGTEECVVWILIHSLDTSYAVT